MVVSRPFFFTISLVMAFCCRCCCCCSADVVGVVSDDVSALPVAVSVVVDADVDADVDSGVNAGVHPLYNRHLSLQHAAVRRQ